MIGSTRSKAHVQQWLTKNKFKHSCSSVITCVLKHKINWRQMLFVDILFAEKCRQSLHLAARFFFFGGFLCKLQETWEEITQYFTLTLQICQFAHFSAIAYSIFIHSSYCLRATVLLFLLCCLLIDWLLFRIQSSYSALQRINQDMEEKIHRDVSV